MAQCCSLLIPTHIWLILCNCSISVLNLSYGCYVFLWRWYLLGQCISSCLHWRHKWQFPWTQGLMLSTLHLADNFFFDDEFDSSSTLYERIVFSKICFGYILSYIGISELSCTASTYQLVGLHMSYRDLSWIHFQLCYNFLWFVLGINSCTLCLMIAEAWNFKLHNNSLICFLLQINYYYY